MFCGVTGIKPRRDLSRLSDGDWRSIPAGLGRNEQGLKEDVLWDWNHPLALSLSPLWLLSLADDLYSKKSMENIKINLKY
jgi:hypothetical protein